LKKPLVAALALVALAGGACGSSPDSPVLEQSGIEAPIRDDKPEAKAAAWKAGRWTGPVTGGFQGDEISFTVSDDGARISDVVFTGHWRCRDGGSSFSSTKTMDVGHVPGEFSVAADGTFGGEQREPYLLWTVTGQPDGSGGGQGTIRIEYDTECDTYKLDWTARPQ
jgi:hypothetical protein